MENSEQPLNDLAEEVIALLTAYCRARDAVKGTEDRRDKWHQYNLKHVALQTKCLKILHPSAPEPEQEPASEAEAPKPAPNPEKFVNPLVNGKVILDLFDEITAEPVSQTVAAISK